MENEAATGRTRDHRPSTAWDRQRRVEQIDAVPQLDFSVDRVNEGSTPYSDYHHVEGLLSLQYPRTDKPAELSFYITGKTQELLSKLLVTEVNRARDVLFDDRLEQALWHLRRAGHVQKMLTVSWEQVSAVTPTEFAALRDELDTASETESLLHRSFRYRRLEFALGGKSPEMVAAYAPVPRFHTLIETTLRASSLYDAVLALLLRRGANIPEECVERDYARPYEPHPAVEKVWAGIYRDASGDLYLLAEALHELNRQYSRWRTTHLLTMKRILGHNPETSDTSGVAWLGPVAEDRFFPELRAARPKI
ncbi:tryptophan 2,3-dioxygenase [Spirillospora sp. CA-255316]